jgi:multiple sugar transport system substrate-binding protein
MAQLFLNQKIAMHVSGRWLVPKYRQEATFDWDVVTFPKGKIGSVVNIDASGYAISQKSKYKKEALRFVEYMTSKDVSNTFAQSGLVVPARIESAYSEAFLNTSQKPKTAKMFLTAVENGKPTEVNENYQKVADILKTTLEPVYLGHKKTGEVFSIEVINLLKSLTYND